MGRKHLCIIIAVIAVLIIIVMVCKREKYHDPGCRCGPNCQCDKRLPRELTERMVQVWTQHLVYTRLVVMAYLAKSPQLKSLSDRLIRNQADIGGLLGGVFGKQIGDTVTRLLVEHIEIAVKVLSTLGDAAANKAAVAQFYSNAAMIGDSLDRLYGTGNLFKHHMKMHIDTLVGDVIAYVGKKDEQDIKMLDEYLNAGLSMAFDMAFATETTLRRNAY